MTILLLDMDGPLANFDLAFWEMCNEEGFEMNIDYLDEPRRRFMTDNIVHKADRVEARRHVEIARYHWFRDLPVVEGAIEGVTALENAGFDVWICTKPLENNWACRDDKAAWVREHLPRLEKKLIMAPNKGMVKGDALLDDAPKMEWLAYAEWNPVVFTTPFNGVDTIWEDLPHWTWGDPIHELTTAHPT